MIGGIDIQIPVRPGTPALEVAVRAVRQAWPRAVFENGLTGERYNTFSEIPFGRLEEIFIYRQAEDADKWETEGAVPELANTMIHLIADAGLLTVVIDREDAQMETIVRAVKSAMKDNIPYAPAQREAA